MKEANYFFDRTKVVCDACGKKRNFKRTEFKSINKELTEGGWRIKQVNGEWLDYCCDKCEVKGRAKKHV